MSTTTKLKPISEMTASEIADMMEHGCVKMENVAPMYVRAIELLRKMPCSAEEAIAAWNRRTAAHGEPTLICKQCGADRLKEDCKGSRQNCDVRGTAQDAKEQGR